MGAPPLLDRRRGHPLRARVLVLPPLEGHVRGSAIDIASLDRAALELAQGFTSPILDFIGSAIGLFGVTEVTFGLALGLAVARWRHGRRDALAPLLIVVAIAIEAALKLTIAHPPPPEDRVRTLELIPTIHVAFANSFPSGHVMRVTFLAAIARGVPTWFATVVVLAMAVSRVYLAEHWLSDCVGGLVIGLVVAGVAYIFFGAKDEATTWIPRGRAGGATRR